MLSSDERCLLQRLGVLLFSDCFIAALTVSGEIKAKLIKKEKIFHTDTVIIC